MESKAEYGNHGLNEEEQQKFDDYARENLENPNGIAVYEKIF